MIIDCHVHCGVADHSAPQSYEDIAPFLDEADVGAAVCFSPVMEIYDRHDPHFEDTSAWTVRRSRSREYLVTLKGRPHRIYPFYFVWNDFDASSLDRYCGIKWHRHPGEPKYRYEDPACARMLEAIREHGFPVVLEEEYDNTMRFIDEIGRGIPVVIPHLGELNGGFHRFWQDDVWSREWVYADMSCDMICRPYLKRFLGRYGPQKLLFGSDYPFGTPISSKEALLELRLPEADLQLILTDNVMRLLKNTGAYDE